MFIMGRQRREFAPEYKDEAVKLVINTGRAVATVARVGCRMGVLFAPRAPRGRLIVSPAATAATATRFGPRPGRARVWT